MTTIGQFNSKSPTVKRILREAAELSASPSPDYHAAPVDDSNIFEWHFTLRGPPEPSPFAHGVYHGRIVLPPTYPLRPPSFRFLTPSGRFEPNREICLSISGHHEESWQPAWGVRTALVALRSFMDSSSAGQLGGVEAGEQVRKRLAGESRRWRCHACGGKSCEEIMKEREEEVKQMGGDLEGKREEKVPDELRLGYKDEMGAEKKKKDQETGSTEATTKSLTAESPESKQSASGTPTSSPSQVSHDRSSSTSAQTSVNRVPQSSTISSPARVVTVSPRNSLNTGWMDSAIAALAVVLGVMVLKKILSLT